jgi:hypothetical protein
LFLACWGVLGSIIGLIITDKFIRIKGKESIFVWILVGIFFTAATATPFIAYKELK